MKLEHFRDCIVRPVLASMADAYNPKLNNQAIENLLICTAVHESDNFNALVQYGGGPAQGVMQIEPDTHDDIWANFLEGRKSRESLKAVVRHYMNDMDAVDQLDGNWFYCVAIARLKYWRARDPLPDAWDHVGLARYYKEIFNTSEGKASLPEVSKEFGDVLQRLQS